MTEKSWLWDGSATGDAQYAPYSKEIFNEWFTVPVSHDHTRAYIVPGVLNNLNITTVGEQAFPTVKVDTGMVVCHRYIYMLDEPIILNISQLSDEGLYRWDALVLQIDVTNQKTRIVLKEGNEASSSPAFPSTTQDDTLWEVVLAHIYVDTLPFTLDEEHLTVYAHFLHNPLYYRTNVFNQIKNPENILYMPSATIMAGWDAVVGTGTVGQGSPLIPQTRGKSLTLTGAGAGEGFRQVHSLDVKAGEPVTLMGVLSIDDATSEVEVSILFYEEEDNTLLSGGAGVNDPTPVESHVIQYTENSTHYIKRTFYPKQDIKSLRITVYGQATTNNFTLGEFLLVPGFFTDGYRSFHQLIPADQYVSDTGWDGDAKSSGTTDLNLTTKYGGVIPDHIRAIILKLRARDSGSAAGSGIHIQILPYGKASPIYGELVLDGIPDNTNKSQHVIVYVDEPFHTSLSSTYGFRVIVGASGAGTLDAHVRVVGVIT